MRQQSVQSPLHLSPPRCTFIFQWAENPIHPSFFSSLFLCFTLSFPLPFCPPLSPCILSANLCLIFIPPPSPSLPLSLSLSLPLSLFPPPSHSPALSQGVALCV